MELENIISFAALIISVISFLTSIIAGIISNRRERRKDTLEAYNRLQNEVFDELNMYTKTDIDQIIQNRRSEAYKELSRLAARIEHFSLGVDLNVYDFKAVKQMGNGYIEEVYRKLYGLIQVKNSRLKNGEMKYYNAFCKLAERMKKAPTQNR